MPPDPPVIRGAPHAAAFEPPPTTDPALAAAGPPPIIVEDLASNSIAMGEPAPKQEPPSAVHADGWFLG